MDFKQNLFYTMYIIIGVISASKLSCNEEKDADLIQQFKTIIFSDPSTFDPKLKTVVLIHGFLSSPRIKWIINMKRALLAREPLNIITVDWSDAFFRANPFDYRKSALATELVAHELSNYLKTIAETIGVPFNEWQSIHFIGHSLGAHIAGYAARILKKRHDMYVSRITGLDPAGPCFSGSGLILKLHKNDAKFVDVIHTNSFANDSSSLGLHEPLGHVDFYPNGGNNQPRCHSARNSTHENGYYYQKPKFVHLFNKVISNHTNGDLMPVLLRLMENPFSLMCDHRIAAMYFIESLNQNHKLWASEVEYPIIIDKKIRCENKKCNEKRCVEMGINANIYNYTSHQTYYIDTSENYLCD